MTSSPDSPVLQPGRTPRVLFLAGGSDDYVADSLLHGLRTLLGNRVVDTPQSTQLYRDQPAEQVARRYGRAFTLYGGLLDDVPIDRTWIRERVHAGEFDLVVIGDIWRRYGAVVELLPVLPRSTTLAVVDGADLPFMYPYSPRLWLTPGGITLPRAHRRGKYFKREITPSTAFWRSFGLLPGGLGTRAGLLRRISPIAISIPEEHLVSDVERSRPQLFQTHIVDTELAGQLGGTVAKPFSTQADYYEDLRSSRFGITVKREGWDALRHYEIAAAGAIPCFRNLGAKPAACAPHGLTDGVNCISYANAEDLKRRIADLSDDDERELRLGTATWARDHTTRAEAIRFLRACGWDLTATPTG